MTGGILATLLATSSSDFAPKYSLTFETGRLDHYDPDWDMLNYWQDASAGFRVGYNLSSKLSLVASYQGAVSTSTISYGGGTEYYDYAEEEYIYSSSDIESVGAQITENIISFGPKLNMPVKRWLVPYATVQGVVAHDVLIMGDTLYDEDAATTFFRDGATGVGALGALGLEVRTRPVLGKTQPIVYFEYGAGITSDLNFSIPDIGVDGENLPIGDLQYGGQHFRFGFGAQF